MLHCACNCSSACACITDYSIPCGLWWQSAQNLRQGYRWKTKTGFGVGGFCAGQKRHGTIAAKRGDPRRRETGVYTGSTSVQYQVHTAVRAVGCSANVIRVCSFTRHVNYLEQALHFKTNNTKGKQNPHVKINSDRTSCSFGRRAFRLLFVF